MVAWAVERMVPHPLRTLTQPLHLLHDPAAGPPRTYILCSEGKQGQPVPAHVQRISADPAWRTVELKAGHVAHVTAPEALVGALVEVAAP